MIMDSQRLLDTGQMIFGIVVIGLIGLVVGFAVQGAEPLAVSLGGDVSERELRIEGVIRIFPGGAAGAPSSRCDRPAWASRPTSSSPSSAPPAAASPPCCASSPA